MSDLSAVGAGVLTAEAGTGKGKAKGSPTHGGSCFWIMPVSLAMIGLLLTVLR